MINHAKTHPREYSSYDHAIQRCDNPNNKDFYNYGGRGIEFRYASFAEFLADVGPCPDGYVLDREDNEGHYEKGNCRWVTYAVSASNRRNWGTLPYRGVFKTSSGKYHAQIRHNGKRVCCPVVDTMEQAATDFNTYVTTHGLKRILNVIKAA